MLYRLRRRTRRERKKLAQAARLQALGLLITKEQHETLKQHAELDAALAAHGLFAEYEPAPPLQIFYVWPCNEPTYELWCSLQTQWRMGMQAPTGLCYAGVHAALELRRVPAKLRQQRFAEIQAMERAALSAWAERREP